MCGIAGLIGKDGVDPACGRAAASARYRIAARTTRAPGSIPRPASASPTAACRSSTCRRGPSADALGRRPLRAQLQWRNLQPRRHPRARGGGGAGRRLARPFATPRLLVQAIAAWGWRRRSPRRRDVRLRPVGPQGALLHLVRDRFGEKPLLLWLGGRDFLFGSELKALRCIRASTMRSTARRSACYAARTYVPAPWSIYRGVFKLPPGRILTLTPAAREPARRRLKTGRTRAASASAATGRIATWSAAAWPIRSPTRRSARALEAALAGDQGPVGGRRAGRRLPVGRDRQLDRRRALPEIFEQQPVRTFSIGFEEAASTRPITPGGRRAHLGTVHHEHLVTVREARDVIPLLPTMYDEPFADSSQIPTFLVSRFAPRAGHGGADRRRRRRVVRRLQPAFPGAAAVGPSCSGAATVPRGGGRIAGPAAAAVSGAGRGHAAGRASTASRRQGQQGAAARRARRAASTTSMPPSSTNGAASARRSSAPDPWRSSSTSSWAAAPDALRIMYCDAVSYLPDDILCKVDRASMAVSLETRVPFLDHRVAEVAARIPLDLKVRADAASISFASCSIAKSRRAVRPAQVGLLSGVLASLACMGLPSWCFEHVDPDHSPGHDVPNAGRGIHHQLRSFACVQPIIWDRQLAAAADAYAAGSSRGLVAGAIRRTPHGRGG